MDREDNATKSFCRDDIERLQAIGDRAHRSLLFVGLLTRALAITSRVHQPIIVEPVPEAQFSVES